MDRFSLRRRSRTDMLFFSIGSMIPGTFASISGDSSIVIFDDFCYTSARMEERKRTIIIGLGNTALTDDGVGVYAARRARELLTADEDIEVEEAEIAGLALLDLLDGCDRAVIIDALNRPGFAPGEASLHSIESFEPTSHLVSGHQIDLPTAVALGHELGQSPPSEIYIVGVQVSDDRTLAERCTEAVERAIDPAARLAVEIAREGSPTPSATCKRSP